LGFAFAPTFSCGFPSFYRTVVLVAVLHSQCRGNVTREHAHTQSAQQRITFFIPQPLITEASQEDTDSRLRTSDILPTPSTDDWVGVGVFQQCRNGQTESFKQINGKSYISTLQTKTKRKRTKRNLCPGGFLSGYVTNTAMIPLCAVGKLPLCPQCRPGLEGPDEHTNKQTTKPTRTIL